MKFKAKPLRSLMFVPGNKPDWMRKAPKYGADALILDLEDSVPPGEKIAARALVRSAVEEIGPSGQTLFVRVNRLETGLTGDDLEAAVSPHVYGIVLSKVECPADVVEVDVLLKYFERRAGIEVGKIFIEAALETAAGLRQAYDIAKASPRVAHMGSGGGKDGDVARAIGYRWTPEQTETLFLRCKVLLDARAAGVQYPISGGWFDIRDLDGLRVYATHLRDLGYHGMHLIHPSQVPVVNEVFTPTPKEIARWQGLAKAVEQGRLKGGAAVTFEGAMVDIAHEDNARAMLEMAREMGLLATED